MSGVEQRSVRFGRLALLCLAVSLSCFLADARPGNAGVGMLIEDAGQYLISSPLTESLSDFTIGQWVRSTLPPPYGYSWWTFRNDEENPLDDYSFNNYGGMYFYDINGPVFDTRGVPLIGSASLSLERSANHFAVSYNATSGNIFFFVDGVLTDSFPCTPNAFNFLSGGRFYIGKTPLTDAVAFSFFGVLDEFFVLNRAVETNSEMRELLSGRPSSPALVSTVVAWWGFENVTGTTVHSELGGYMTAKSVRSDLSVSAALQRPGPAIVLVPSPMPMWGSGVLSYRTIPNTPVFINMSSPILSGVPAVTSLPTSGTVYNRLPSGARGAALTAGDLPFSAPNGVEYEAAVVSPVSFQFTLAGETGTVLIERNHAPSTKNITAFISQGDTVTILYARLDYRDPSVGGATLYRFAADLDGEVPECKIASLPTNGVVLSVPGGDVINSTMLPFTTVDCYITIAVPAELVGTAASSFQVALTDRFETSTYTFFINALDRYLPQKSIPASVTALENTTVVVPLVAPAVVNHSVPDPIFAGIGSVFAAPWPIVEPLYAQVTKLPEHGKLYKKDRRTGARGSEIQPRGQRVLAQKQQWASDWIAASSIFSSPNDPALFSPNQTFDEPDVFPAYAYDGRAWCGGGLNSYEWIVVKYAQKVIPTEVAVYQNYLSNTVWRISALNPSTGQYVMLWQQQDQSLATAKSFAFLTKPELCPVTFFTDTIMVELAPPRVFDVVEIDAISLTGYTEQANLDVLDLVDVQAIEYVPEEYYSGNDSFSYTLNRCLYYAKNRFSGLTPADISIRIQPVNQKPIAQSVTVRKDFGNQTIYQPNYIPTIDFNITVFDRDSDQALTVRVVSLPTVGTVVRVSAPNRALVVGDSFPASEQLRYVGVGCYDNGDTGNQLFVFTASDGVVVTEPSTVTLQADCVGKIQRVSKGVEIFIFVICGISVVIILGALGLVVLWRDRKAIRSMSPLFCILILTGALSTVISPIFLMPTLISCMSFTSFFTIGLVLFFSNLAAKTYRIDRIFNNEGMTVFSISNFELLAYTGSLLALQIVALIIWGVVTRIEPTVVPFGDGGVYMCYSNHWQTVVGVEYSFLILIFVFTAIFAWRVRSIPISEYKESREIFLSVYNVGFVALICVPLAMLQWQSPATNAIAIGVGTCFAAVVSTLVLFLPKFIRLAKGENSTTSPTATGTGGRGKMMTSRQQSRTTPRSGVYSSSSKGSGANESEVEMKPNQKQPKSQKSKEPSSSSSSSSTASSAEEAPEHQESSDSSEESS